MSGNIFDCVAFFDPTFIHFRNIIVTPSHIVAFVVDDGHTDGSKLAAFFIEDQIAGDARIILNVGIVELQRSRAGVLRRRRIFIHEAPAEFVHRDPNHLAIFISRAGPDVANRKWELWKFESVTAVEMPHVPQRGASLLRHLDAVAGIAEINRINRLRFEVL